MGCSLLASCSDSESETRRFDSCLPSVEQYEAPQHEIEYSRLWYDLYNGEGDFFDKVKELRAYQQKIAIEQGSYEQRRILNKYGDT